MLRDKEEEPVMLPTFYNRQKAKVASASSLESYIGTITKGSKSATEDIDEYQIDRTTAEKDLFLEKALFDTLTDGRIFFSVDPSQAYDEFIEEAKTLKPLIVRDLKKYSAPETDLDRYNFMRSRRYSLETELREREKEVAALRAQLVAASPELDDTLED